MLISLTTKEFDIAGDVLLDVESQNLGETRRRLSRVATLDGGASVNDFGFSSSDRTIAVDWIPSTTEDETIRRIVELHQRVRLSTRIGCFECVIDSYSERSGRATLSLLSLERLSA